MRSSDDPLEALGEAARSVQRAHKPRVATPVAAVARPVEEDESMREARRELERGLHAMTTEMFVIDVRIRFLEAAIGPLNAVVDGLCQSFQMALGAREAPRAYDRHCGSSSARNYSSDMVTVAAVLVLLVLGFLVSKALVTLIVCLIVGAILLTIIGHILRARAYGPTVGQMVRQSMRQAANDVTGVVRNLGDIAIDNARREIGLLQCRRRALRLVGGRNAVVGRFIADFGPVLLTSLMAFVATLGCFFVALSNPSAGILLMTASWAWVSVLWFRIVVPIRDVLRDYPLPPRDKEPFAESTHYPFVCVLLLVVTLGVVTWSAVIWGNTLELPKGLTARDAPSEPVPEAASDAAP